MLISFEWIFIQNTQFSTFQQLYNHYLFLDFQTVSRLQTSSLPVLTSGLLCRKHCTLCKEL